MSDSFPVDLSTFFDFQDSDNDDHQDPFTEELIRQQAQRLRRIERRQNGRRERSWRKTFMVYSPVFMGVSMPLDGDNVILPASALEELSQTDIDFPLLFTATNQAFQDLNPVACRALEFTAPPEFAYFPSSLMEKMLLEEGSLVTLEYKKLPKATFVKLKPLEGNEFLQWSNQKAIFEYTLRSYATLTLNHIIQVKFESKLFNFEVTELKPEPLVCIIDTDVEVEFENALDFDVNTNPISSNPSNPFDLVETHEDLPKKEKPIEIPSVTNDNNNKNHNQNGSSSSSLISNGGRIDQPNNSLGGFQIRERNEQVSTPTVNSGGSTSQGRRVRRQRGDPIPESSPQNSNSGFKSFSGAGQRLDSPAPKSSSSNFTPATRYSDGSSLVTNSQSSSSLGSPTSVNISSSPQRTLNPSSLISDPISSSSSPSIENSNSPEETLPVCENCLKNIPSAAMLTHEAFCQRNNFRCPDCNQVMPKHEKDRHIQEQHSTIPCPDCEELVERSQMDTHLNLICMKRRELCEFCSMQFPLNEYGEHVSLCGSRTEKCELCDRFVMLIDLAEHLHSACEYPPSHEMSLNHHRNQPGFVAPPSDDDGDGFGFEEETLLICPYCMVPFTEFDELESHIVMQPFQLGDVIFGGDLREVKMVLSHFDTDMKNSLSKKQLHEFALRAIKSENALSLLKELIENEILSFDDDLFERGESVMHLAAGFGSAEVVKFLIQSGMNVNKKNITGDTPLHFLASRNNFACLLPLILGGAEMNQENEIRKIPLVVAADNGSLESVRGFLLNGSPVGKLSNKSWKMVQGELVRSIWEKSTGTEPLDEVLLKNLGSVLKSCSMKRVSMVQRILSNKARRLSENVCCSQKSLQYYGAQDSVVVTLQNTGSLPFQMNCHFPELDGVQFSFHSLSDTVQVDETVDIEIKIEKSSNSEDVNLKSCIFIEISNESDDSLRFYHFVILDPKLLSEKE